MKAPLLVHGNVAALFFGVRRNPLRSHTMDRDEKQIDLAKEAITQQITLATALVGAVIAFADSIKDVAQGAIWVRLPLALVPLGISVVCGVLALQAIAFCVTGSGRPLSKWSVRICGIVQNVSFLLEICVLVWIVAATGH